MSQISMEKRRYVSGLAGTTLHARLTVWFIGGADILCLPTPATEEKVGITNGVKEEEI